jgi:hypothetical protein
MTTRFVETPPDGSTVLLTEDDFVIRTAHAARTGGDAATFFYFDKDEEHMITGRVSFTGPGELPFRFSVAAAEP